MRHAGKVAVVTGAAQGIGLACATLLHEQGARVVLADIDTARAEAAAHTLANGAATAIAVACDVASRSAVEALFATTIRAFGTVDIAVNNAATTVAADPLELSEEDFDRVIGVNLKGTLFGCQEAARIMVANGGGAIVNMSSM